MKKIVVKLLIIFSVISLFFAGCNFQKTDWLTEQGKIYDQQLPLKFSGVLKVVVDLQEIEFLARYQNEPGMFLDEDTSKNRLIAVPIEGENTINIEVDPAQFPAGKETLLVHLTVNRWLSPGLLYPHAYADDVTITVWSENMKDRLETAIKFAQKESKKSNPSPLIPIRVF